MPRACHCGSYDHLLHLRPRAGRELDAEVILVAGGKRVYLWIGRPGSEEPIVIDGPAQLRQIATALLKELGD